MRRGDFLGLSHGYCSSVNSTGRTARVHGNKHNAHDARHTWLARVDAQDSCSTVPFKQRVLLVCALFTGAPAVQTEGLPPHRPVRSPEPTLRHGDMANG